MAFLAPFIPAIIGGGSALLGARNAKKQAKNSANQSRQASGESIAAQREALAYTQEKEQALLAARDMGLGGLMDLYDPNNPQGQQDMINRAQSSPLYNQIMGNRQFGEDAIMRNASATGGLRSGNVNYNLNDYNTRLSNDALLQSYNQELSGLQGLSRTSTNTNAIANQMAGIGNTRAQGTVAAGQAQQQGNQNAFNNVMGGVNLGLDAYNSGVFSGSNPTSFGSAGNSTYGYNVGGYSDASGGLGFSDNRLKRCIKYMGMNKGHKWYSWKWNDKAKKLGLKGEGQGVMVSNVVKYMPEAIGEHEGYATVNYNMLEAR